MTRQERDYNEVLSRVLHSTTDHIEPVGDGLTKIQARLAEPWLKRQWWLLRNEFTAIGWVLAVRCQSWFNHMRSGSATGADTGVVTTGKASATLAGQGGRLRSLPVAGGIAAASLRPGPCKLSAAQFGWPGDGRAEPGHRGRRGRRARGGRGFRPRGPPRVVWVVLGEWKPARFPCLQQRW